MAVTFEYNGWIVNFHGNSIEYWPNESPFEKRVLFYSGGDQSLIKSFLDNINLGREVERIHAQEVSTAIEGELADGAFSEVEKQLLVAELNRLRKSMNT
jgi:hypothetical protein